MRFSLDLIGSDWGKSMGHIRFFQSDPMNNIRWPRGLINNGGTLSIINGGHELMGDTLWELVKLMFFTRNLIRNRSVGDFVYIFNDQQ